MNEAGILSGDGIVKTYGDNEVRLDALCGITIEIAAGEFVALRGPSGCGKSTLLHILGAMDRPTHGVVTLAGRRLDTLTLDQLAAVRRKQVGFVFQAFNLLPTLRVEENVKLPLMLDGVSDADAKDRVRESLAEVGLGDRRSHFPSQLSGGEMQRVAIARALAIDPKVIIADEPTGSLDSANGRRVLELLTDLNQSKRITVLMATHSAEACGYASRTLHLRDGQIDNEAGAKDVSTTV